MVSALLCVHIPTSDLIVCGVLKYTWVDSLYERQTGCYQLLLSTGMGHVIHVRTFQKGSQMSQVPPPPQLVSVWN
jgi:hypothetical protein